MKKKSQITLFIILGLFLVMGAAFLIYTNTQRIEQEFIDTSSVKHYTQKCLEEAAEITIAISGLRGGFMEQPTDRMSLPGFDTVYLYSSGLRNVLTKEIIQREFSRMYPIPVEVVCTYDFFEKQGFDISVGNVTSDLIIRDEDILLNVDYPLTVKQGDSVSEFSKFTMKFPIRLNYMIETINNVTAEIESHPDISEPAYYAQFGLNFRLFQVKDNEKLFVVSDPISNVQGSALVYAFGVRR